MKFNPWRLGGVDTETEVPSCEVDERHCSMEAAADVVEAMAVAEIGSGWLCVPS